MHGESGGRETSVGQLPGSADHPAAPLGSRGDVLVEGDASVDCRHRVLGVASLFSAGPRPRADPHVPPGDSARRGPGDVRAAGHVRDARHLRTSSPVHRGPVRRAVVWRSAADVGRGLLGRRRAVLRDHVRRWLAGQLHARVSAAARVRSARDDFSPDGRHRHHRVVLVRSSRRAPAAPRQGDERRLGRARRACEDDDRRGARRDARRSGKRNGRPVGDAPALHRLGSGSRDVARRHLVRLAHAHAREPDAPLPRPSRRRAARFARGAPASARPARAGARVPQRRLHRRRRRGGARRRISRGRNDAGRFRVRLSGRSVSAEADRRPRGRHPFGAAARASRRTTGATMITMLSLPCAATLALLTVLALYEWALAVLSLVPWNAPAPRSAGRSRLLVLIPAYNEETGVAATVRSLQNGDYPKDAVRMVVIADRCTDGTAGRARACGAECLERRAGEPGKGAAIAWALDELARGGAEYDALVLIDADTIADRRMLAAFDEHLRAGHEVQQGYHYLSNPWASPFTRIISVTGILRNGLYYVGKERLGLPSML